MFLLPSFFRRFARLLLGSLALSCTQAGQVAGSLHVWHTVELTFEGPMGSEQDSATFRDHRLTVTLAHDDTTLVIPGFFAADGNAGRSHATAGNKWRARFTPDRAGEWQYRAKLATGPGIAITREAGTPVPLAEDSGRFLITPSPVPSTSPDFRGHGHLQYVHRHHLQFAGSRKFFLKGGSGSPENFLAFDGFDGTYDDAQTPGFPALGEDQLHHYGPHRRDWHDGDPNWTNEKGHDAKGIIGLANYLGAQGLNSLYFMPLTYEGDGGDVWPWVDPARRDTFDVSKLAQWEYVFAHLQHRGVHLHMLVTETENENLFELRDGGAPFADTRKLYYRELIARFGHHLALSWNLGEENGWTDEKGGDAGIGNTTAQRKAFSRFIRDLDPYDHPIKIHEIESVEIYPALVGFEAFEGPALQRHEHYNQHVIEHLAMSQAGGRPWVVSMDEPLGWEFGLRPDHDDPTRDHPRRDVLWGTLMAGGSGVEWYFGWQNNAPTSDLSSEDLRVRETMWPQTRLAREFFERHVPFAHMSATNDLTAGESNWVLARTGDTYLVYLRDGGEASIDLTGVAGTYDVRWFDPRHGGALQMGVVHSIDGGGMVELGRPPRDPDQDWAILLQRQ